MAFYIAFSNFISWIFDFECFRLCIALICCLTGLFIVSEIVRYMAFSFGGDEKE